VLHTLPAHTVTTLTSKTFLPQLLTGPFHSGLTVVFILAAVLAVAGAVVSLFRGGVYIHDEIAQKSGTAPQTDEVIEGDGAAGEVLGVDGDDGQEPTSGSEEVRVAAGDNGRPARAASVRAEAGLEDGPEGGVSR
jgi:hypothetical protein